MQSIEPPYFPIIYVRGYAMFEKDIADTVATPYMGFNDGSMKERRDFRAKPKRHAFESPLLRLIKDYSYHDIYRVGEEWALGDSPRIIVIHRYYDEADQDLGTGQHQTVTQAAQDLGKLILKLRDAIYKETIRGRGGETASTVVFGVHLVAHSMGGLICRAFLQNPEIGDDDAKRLVRRVFTFGTPHDGIRFRRVWIPGAASLFAENQFSHLEMARYLAIHGNPEHVNTLQGQFPTGRFFCLVGTNHADYSVGWGASRFVVGPESDGLVQTANAILQGDGPTAYVYRSHSGHYGIVNSEEGYQNLIRFLFSEWRIDGGLTVDDAPLPPSLDNDRDNRLRVETAFFIEVEVTPLGSTGYRLTQRKIDHNSAIVRRETELVSIPRALEQPSAADVSLFSMFSDRETTSVVFNVALAISPTEYAVEGRADPSRYIPGEYLFQDTIRIQLLRGDAGWQLFYGLTSEGWGESSKQRAEETAEGVFVILLSTRKFRGTLRIVLTRMTDEPSVEQPIATAIDKGGPPGGEAIKGVQSTLTEARGVESGTKTKTKVRDLEPA